MYLSDIASESYYSRAHDRDADSMSMSHSGGQRAHARRSSQAYVPLSPAPPTSIPLDDNFDAPTTEVPTEWAIGDPHPEYDESVSGYRNYVTEMERMLAGKLEGATARAQERQYQRQHARAHPPPLHPQAQSMSSPTHPRRTLRRSDLTITESLRGSSRMGGGGGGGGGYGTSTNGDGRRASITIGPGSPTSQQHRQPTLLPIPASPVPPPENARKVSGKKGQIELVQQRVLEDSPARTISLWRERVAQSSAGGGEVDGEGFDARSETNSHARAHANGRGHANGQGHRRTGSGSHHPDPRLRRVVSEQVGYGNSMDGSGTRNGSVKESEGRARKHSRVSYERSEYMISYRQAAEDGVPAFIPRSEVGSISGSRRLRTPSSPTLSRAYDRGPPSPTARRHAPRKSLEKNEFTMVYPQTPPLSGSQSSSPGARGKHPHAVPRSPVVQGSFRDGELGGSIRTPSTSSVEVILSSCDPSLLHIAPVLYELGVRRVDHLRAVARLSEDTRDREVKEQALRRGVTVVEWAIFLDKLQSL